MYYLRARPAADAIKFTVDVEMLLKDGGQIEVKNSVTKPGLSNATPNTVNKENMEEEEEEGKASKKKVKTGMVVCSLKDEDGQCMSCGS